MLDIFLLGACRWSELFIYFGSFAFRALKFKFFVGRLIANKRLPITDNCQKIIKKTLQKKARRINIHLQKQKETKLKQETKKEERKSKRKLETVGNGKIS